VGITEQRELESEASQLSAIYATIILNMRRRLEREQESRKSKTKKKQSDT